MKFNKETIEFLEKVEKRQNEKGLKKYKTLDIGVTLGNDPQVVAEEATYEQFDFVRYMDAIVQMLEEEHEDFSEVSQIRDDAEVLKHRIARLAVKWKGGNNEK